MKGYESILSRTSAAVGISAAAFGAHALKGRPGMTPERVDSWVRAANYMVRRLSEFTGSCS